MSAEVLRRAAALMRERAEAASPSPWIAAVRPGGRAWVDVPGIDGHAWSLHGFSNDAKHIASWHPLVALAVTDLLEAHAVLEDECRESWEEMFDDPYAGSTHPTHVALLSVARAYLGESS